MTVASTGKDHLESRHRWGRLQTTCFSAGRGIIVCHNSRCTGHFATWIGPGFRVNPASEGSYVGLGTVVGHTGSFTWGGPLRKLAQGWENFLPCVLWRLTLLYGRYLRSAQASRPGAPERVLAAERTPEHVCLVRVPASHLPHPSGGFSTRKREGCRSLSVVRDDLESDESVVIRFLLFAGVFWMRMTENCSRYDRSKLSVSSDLTKTRNGG